MCVCVPPSGAGEMFASYRHSVGPNCRRTYAADNASWCYQRQASRTGLGEPRSASHMALLAEMRLCCTNQASLV